MKLKDGIELFIENSPILMAEEVQKKLDERSDYEILEDRSSDLWFY